MAINPTLTLVKPNDLSQKERELQFASESKNVVLDSLPF